MTVIFLVDIENPFVLLALSEIGIVINFAGLADISDYSEKQLFKGWLLAKTGIENQIWGREKVV